VENSHELNQMPLGAYPSKQQNVDRLYLLDNGEWIFLKPRLTVMIAGVKQSELQHPDEFLPEN